MILNKTDIGSVSGGHVRSECFFKKGKIFRKEDLLNMNAYPDFIKAVKCTGERLREHL